MRPLALILALAVAGAPLAVVAQTTPRSTASPAPQQTMPAPLATPSSGARTPIPATTGAPGIPEGATESGGGGAIDASALPTLAPADQNTPLPYPAYGTPAPVTAGVAPPSNVPQTITLQQAVLIAYAQAPALAADRAAVQIATAPLITAEGALTPSLSASASSTANNRQLTNAGQSNVVGGGGGNTPVSVGNKYSTLNIVDATLRQLIFDGGRVAAQVREARANLNASVDTYERDLQTTGFNVATTYYNALSAQRTTQVALQTVRIDQVQENLVAAQIRAGTTARADLATAQLSTAQARVAVVRAQAAELNALAAFSNALGLDANIRVQPKDDVPALSVNSGTLAISPSFPTPSYNQALARAYALRPDLNASHQSVVAFENALKAARLGHFPTLDATGGYTMQSTNLGGGAFRNAASGGLELSIPFLDQGATHAAVTQAQGQLDQANANFAVAQQGVQLSVRQALVNLVSAYAALTQSNAELVQAQTVLKSTQAQYRAGVTTLPLLLNAQVGITQALTDEVTNAYAVRQAEQALLYAEGANAAG